MDADVIVIGYGPVGMVTAAALGERGHRVIVLERYEQLYNLPRAAIFDDETMRTFAGLGIEPMLRGKVHASNRYEWVNGTGELLLEHSFADRGRSGWAEWYEMYQPDLETALDELCRRTPSVEVRLGATVTDVDATEDGVAVKVDGRSGPETLQTYWVVGCDGGNSSVRRALGLPQEDYGFSEPWMVCDFRLTGPHDLPLSRQVCDPVQPISVISLGPAHHRFSFMLDSAEDFETEQAPDKVWERVSGYLGRHQAEIVRVATYTFRSLVTDPWRIGRIVLAGDSAHQMPPFLGQGMCSGIRDAQNLAFKLDWALRGGADLLDTYQLEREPHVRAVIEKGIELGRLQTVRDPILAAARDTRLQAQRTSGAPTDKLRFPGLTGGFRYDSPGAGELFPQGDVARPNTEPARFDGVVGPGAHLVGRGQALANLIADGRIAALTAAGVRCVAIDHQPGHTDLHSLEDTDATYTTWLDEHQADIVLVRPDLYVFGTATHSSGPNGETDQHTDALIAAYLQATPPPTGGTHPRADLEAIPA